MVTSTPQNFHSFGQPDNPHAGCVPSFCGADFQHPPLIICVMMPHRCKYPGCAGRTALGQDCSTYPKQPRGSVGTGSAQALETSGSPTEADGTPGSGAPGRGAQAVLDFAPGPGICDNELRPSPASELCTPKLTGGPTASSNDRTAGANTPSNPPATPAGED